MPTKDNFLKNEQKKKKITDSQKDGVTTYSG